MSEASQSVSYKAMAGYQQDLADVILQDKDVESLSSFIGVDGVNSTLNNGRILINLKPHSDRDSIQKIIRRLQQNVDTIPNIKLYLQASQDLTIEDHISRTQYQFTVESANAGELDEWIPLIVDKLSTLAELTNVASDYQNKGLQAYVVIHRDDAARLGVTVAAVDNALYNAFGQRLISTIFTQTNQYRVVLEAKKSIESGPNALNDIYVPSSSGQQVPLKAIAHVQEQFGLLTINHQGQFPSATISFDLSKGYSLGDSVKAIDKAQKIINVPSSVVTRYQGAAQAFSASLTNTLWLILAAILTMYIVLGVLYESYIHPLTILSTLPSAGVGALLALIISNNDLGIIGIIGIILLIGIVKKNAIMMIDFALDAERNENKSARDAIYDACLLRLRPILMTTMVGGVTVNAWDRCGL